jgi:hypothetical protein
MRVQQLRPEFVRNVDQKGRVALPACIAGRFPVAARLTLLPSGVVSVEAAAAGRSVQRVKRGSPNWRTSRVTVPVEFRELTRIRPGTRVGLATHAGGLFLWALEGGR